MAVATHDVELVEYFFAHTITPALVAVLVPGAVLATLAWHAPPLALALVPFLAAVGLSPFLARHRLDRLGSRAREALGDLNAHAVDTVQGLPDIIAFEQVGPRRAQFLERARRHVALRLPFFRDLTLQNVFLEVATGLGGLAIVVIGGLAAQRGAIDPAVLPLLALLAMAAFLPVSEIAHIGRQLADTLGATRRLHGIWEEPVPVEDGPGVPPRESPVRAATAPSGAPASAIVLEGVWFRYPLREEPALRDVTLRVEPGQTVALVGPSGAGKSTVAHLLLRFFDPDRGRVRLLGHDARDYRLDHLRSLVALVAQDTWLFNESLRSNIRLARPDASEGELARAVEEAALSELVASLPDGLDTRVGERGVRLSGGQRQRVAIARAILKEAPILVLDEATSHLDAVNERAVRKALERLMGERTTLVIAHRLSSVRDADRIVVLEAGEVVEAGRHAELLARPGLYRRLVGHQLGALAGARRIRAR